MSIRKRTNSPTNLGLSNHRHRYPYANENGNASGYYEMSWNELALHEKPYDMTLRFFYTLVHWDNVIVAKLSAFENATIDCRTVPDPKIRPSFLWALFHLPSYFSVKTLQRLFTVIERGGGATVEHALFVGHDSSSGTAFLNAIQIERVCYGTQLWRDLVSARENMDSPFNGVQPPLFISIHNSREVEPSLRDATASHLVEISSGRALNTYDILDDVVRAFLPKTVTAMLQHPGIHIETTPLENIQGPLIPIPSEGGSVHDRSNTRKPKGLGQLSEDEPPTKPVPIDSAVAYLPKEQKSMMARLFRDVYFFPRIHAALELYLFPRDLSNLVWLYFSILGHFV